MKYKFPLFTILAIAAFIIGKKIYMKPSYSGGQAAPNFTGKMLSGADFELDNLKGNYILLDFWGSWCGPCIADNPKLIALNAKFGDKQFKDAEGFEIVSVAVEKREERWKRAVEKYQLNWEYHVIDLATDFRFFDSEIAGKYGVKEVPTKFLINTKGEIVGVNLSAAEIDAYLSERML